jgi:arylsulfatase A-like enzyme
MKDFERDDDKPWFLYVATVAPHAPFTVAPQYKGADVPVLSRRSGLPPSFHERDRSDKPDLPARPFELERSRKLRKKQWRTLLSVDDLMRKLRSSLQQLDEERDTLVIFTSDQGILQGEHGLYAKRLPYTESIQMPLLLRWPGHVEGGTEDKIVANVDIAPTLYALAGVEPSTVVDGVSLFSDTHRSELFMEQLENWRVGLADWRSIRGPDFQYIEYFGRGGNMIDREYYDLKDDPWQLRNLFGDDDPTNDPDVAELSKQIAELSQCSGSGCVKT